MSDIVDASNYLLTLNQLSKRGETTTEVAPPAPTTIGSSSLSSIPYLPFVLVGLLFVGALSIQVVAKIRSAKALMTALVFALFAASIPSALTYIQHGTQNQTNASPQTQPKTFTVAYATPTTAVFAWHTDIPTIGGIRIWPKDNPNETKVIVEEHRSKVTAHTLTISNLTIGASYAFEILSDAEWYGDRDQPIILHFISP